MRSIDFSLLSRILINIIFLSHRPKSTFLYFCFLTLFKAEHLGNRFFRAVNARNRDSRLAQRGWVLVEAVSLEMETKFLSQTVA